MSKIDFWYSIVCLVGLVANTMCFYYGITRNNKLCIALLCFQVALSACNYSYEHKKDSVLYGFIKGLTGDKE